MAMISMLFIFLMALLFFVGIVLLIVAIVMLITRAIRKSKGKNVSTVSLVFGIIFLIAGIMMSLPLGGLLAVGFASEASNSIKYDNLENSVMGDYDTWKDGFDFEDKHLVLIEDLKSSKDLEETTVGHLKFDSNKEYKDINLVENTSGYEIYNISGNIMVDEADLDAITDYYYNDASVTVSIQWISAPGKAIPRCDCDFDKYRLYDIRSLYSSGNETIQKPVEDAVEDIDFVLTSTDQLFRTNISLYIYDDCVVLCKTLGANGVTGYSLSEEDAQYVREIFEEYKDSCK